MDGAGKAPAPTEEGGETNDCEYREGSGGDWAIQPGHCCGQYVVYIRSARSESRDGTLPEGIALQTEQALANLGAILTEAGFQRSDVVKVTVFITSMSDFPTVNAIYESFFGSHKPARSCIEVAALPKAGLVEIEAVAMKEATGA